MSGPTTPLDDNNPKERDMDALTCAFCDAVGTPATMYWHPVEGDHDDDGQPVAVYGVLCRKHALESDAEEAWWSKRKPMPGDTVADQDRDDDRPSQDDLREWVDAHGASEELFVDECIEGADLPGHVDMVPYGSTSVPLASGPEWDDVPDQVKIDTAETWWQDGRIDWVLDPEKVGQEERTMSLAVVGTTTRRSNA